MGAGGVMFGNRSALSQSGEISPDFSRFYGGGIRHNEDIMHSFQNFIVWLIPSRNKDMEISCESAVTDIPKLLVLNMS